MTADGRWRKVEDLFGAALDVPPEDRQRFLAVECAGDAALHREVESLLAASDKADSVFERRSQVMKPLAAALRSEALIGRSLGPYRVDAHLGEGGMGIVYHAIDARSGAAVALKVLPPEVIGEPERRRRFALESRAASALDHPNIAKVLEIGCEGDLNFIAMEYVEGRPLQALFTAGLPLRDALSSAIQIASALSAAHAAGIVHRDIKPANILVTESGAVKLVDFGLCKLTESAADQLDSESSLTRAGAIVGTTAYMSPEQAEGKPADGRSDIFSLGSVLYEMVAGRRAFRGDTSISTLAAILRGDPEPICEVVPHVPPAVEAVILRCLAKDPARRFQTAADVMAALEGLRLRLDTGRLRRPLVPVRYRKRVYAALAVGLLAAAIAWLLLRPQATPSGSALVQLTFDSGLTTHPALSPDGKLLSYASDRAGATLSIWVQHLPNGKPARLTLDPVDHSEPSISPDGSTVAFRAEHDGGGVYAIPTRGGNEKLVAKGGRRPRFSPDGKWIAYWTGAEGSGDPDAPGGAKVFVIPSSGGDPRQIQPEFAAARSPVWFPDGKYLLFVGRRDPAASAASWWAAPLTGGPPVESLPASAFRDAALMSDLTPQAWMPDHRVIGSGDLDTTLWRIAISPETRRSIGRPGKEDLGTQFHAFPATSSAGRTVFTTLATKTSFWAVPIAPDGGEPGGEASSIVGTWSGAVMNASLSADGRRISYQDGGALWKQDLATGQRNPLASRAEWSAIRPDGAHVAFSASSSFQQEALFLAPWEGGQQKMLADRLSRVWDLSPDGKQVLDLPESVQPRAVELVDLASGKRINLLRHASWNLYLAHFSPDGRWIVFDAKSGPDRSQIFIAPFSGPFSIPPDRWIAVTNGSSRDSHAWWSPGGSRLYFISERDGHRCLWSQPLTPSTKAPIGAAVPLYHSHRAGVSLGNVARGFLTLSVSRDKVLFPLGEKTGNIWMK